MTAAYQVPRHHANLYKEQVTKDPVPQDPGFAAELFHRLYSESPRELPPSPGNAMRRAMHSLVSELPEFETLRHATTRDPLWASIATQAMGHNVAPKVPPNANVEKANAVLEGLQDMQADHPGNAKIAEALQKAQADLNEAVRIDNVRSTELDESAIRNALRVGIAQAADDIAQAESALSLLGYGIGEGPTPNTASSPAVALELARKVRSSVTLSKIVELAGRLVSQARAKKASRSEYARSEVVGVEKTNDVAHLLGSEIALLSDPDLSDDLLMRLLEKRALGYKMRGKEKLSKGPIVLMLDQSGSMDGPNDIWAKAIALAIYDSARTDNRAFSVVTYDGVVRRVVNVASPLDMIAVLSLRADGYATDYREAMEMSLKLCTNKADIIHITDGSAPSSGAADAVARADQLGIHIYGIGIGIVGPALAAWSHTCTTIRDVSKDTQAMDLIFGEGGI